MPASNMEPPTRARAGSRTRVGMCVLGRFLDPMRAIVRSRAADLRANPDEWCERPDGTALVWVSMSAQVDSHYRSLLASRYTWMMGGLDRCLASARELLDNTGVLPST